MRLRGRERPAVLSREVLLVLGVSLGMSAVYSIVRFIGKLTEVAPLAQQTTSMNTTRAAGRPWLDLALQLVAIATAVMPALLAVHLLHRDEPPALIGVDRTRPRFDTGTGFALAALIGIPGLGLYLGAVALGVNTRISAASLPPYWWAVPVLILAALANGILEEVVMIGYLLTRLRDIGWRTWHAVLASALIRGSYHLYQGLGGFVGNAIMGVIFALFYLRFKRVLPLIIAHTVLDVVAFVGYTYLRGVLTFL